MLSGVSVVAWVSSESERSFSREKAGLLAARMYSQGPLTWLPARALRSDLMRNLPVVNWGAVVSVAARRCQERVTPVLACITMKSPSAVVCHR